MRSELTHLKAFGPAGMLEVDADHRRRTAGAHDGDHGVVLAEISLW